MTAYAGTDIDGSVQVEMNELRRVRRISVLSLSDEDRTTEKFWQLLHSAYVRAEASRLSDVWTSGEQDASRPYRSPVACGRKSRSGHVRVEFTAAGNPIKPIVDPEWLLRATLSEIGNEFEEVFCQ